MRVAGIVQVALVKSNSSGLALIASLVLDAVRMVNSRQRADTPDNARSLETNPPTSGKGIAVWCVTRCFLESAGSNWLRCPFQRAGFSPVRYPLALAQSRMFSIRPRNRLAVSDFVAQIGSRIFRTSPVSTA